MSDYLREEIEKTAYNCLKENSPGLIEVIRAFISAGYSTDEIIAVCCEKSGRAAADLAFIGCACDHMQRISVN